MSSKMVRLDEGVYERLRQEKREGETFSDAVDRLLDDVSLLDLVGIYSREEVDEIERSLAETESRDRANRRSERR